MYNFVDGHKNSYIICPYQLDKSITISAICNTSNIQYAVQSQLRDSTCQEHNKVYIFRKECHFALTDKKWTVSTGMRITPFWAVQSGHIKKKKNCLLLGRAPPTEYSPLPCSFFTGSSSLFLLLAPSSSSIVICSFRFESPGHIDVGCVPYVRTSLWTNMHRFSQGPIQVRYPKQRTLLSGKFII